MYAKGGERGLGRRSWVARRVRRVGVQSSERVGGKGCEVMLEFRLSRMAGQMKR